MAEKKKGTDNFIAAMLESASTQKETEAQTRFDHVDEQELGSFMAKLQKGKIRE